MSNFIVVDNNKSDLELTTLTMNKIGKVVTKLIKMLIQVIQQKDGWTKRKSKKKKMIETFKSFMNLVADKSASEGYKFDSKLQVCVLKGN